MFGDELRCCRSNNLSAAADVSEELSSRAPPLPLSKCEGTPRAALLVLKKIKTKNVHFGWNFYGFVGLNCICAILFKLIVIYNN